MDVRGKSTQKWGNLWQYEHQIRDRGRLDGWEGRYPPRATTYVVLLSVVVQRDIKVLLLVFQRLGRFHSHSHNLYKLIKTLEPSGEIDKRYDQIIYRGETEVLIHMKKKNLNLINWRNTNLNKLNCFTYQISKSFRQ